MKVARRNDLSLRLLEVFGTVMACQTTVQSAEELGISQPAVSAAIQALERQVGFALFERRSRRLVPTEEARSLYREVEPIFGMLRSVEHRVRDLREGAAGKLRILATPPLGHSLAPRALKRFLEGGEGVVIDYDVRRAEHVVEAIALGASDVGLVLGGDDRAEVNVEVIDEAEMLALVPSSHPLAFAGEICPGDAAAAGHVGLHGGSRLGALLRGAFRAEGVAYAPRVEVRYCHTAAVLANAGIGIAVVDRFTADFLSTLDLVTLPFRPVITVPCCVLTRAGAPASRLAARFIGEIKRAAAEARTGTHGEGTARTARPNNQEEEVPWQSRTSY